MSNIDVHLYNIDSNAKMWLNYKASMKINKSGRFKAEGKFRHTPLKQSGAFSFENLELADINPYLNESAFVKITDL
ncbi:MAG: DUF748 domain-containing protein [Campylobacterales bacterium]|nr:DUF748 domain-containing protein [Campylobacterales bacterium]